MALCPRKHTRQMFLTAFLGTILLQGDVVTRFKKTLGFNREYERFVVICPQTATVYWTKPGALPPGTTKAGLPGRHEVNPETLESWARTCQDCKYDKLVGVMPATSKHVPEKHREQAFVLVTETTELVLAAKDAAKQRSWLAAAHSILGRARDALMLAGVKAVEESLGQASEKILDAKAMEEAAAAAKAKAEEEADAARVAAAAEAAAAKAKAEAEILAAKQRAEADAEAARAEAAAEAAAAKAAASAELQEAQKQLDKAIKEHGGERLELKEPRGDEHEVPVPECLPGQAGSRGRLAVLAQALDLCIPDKCADSWRRPLQSASSASRITSALMMVWSARPSPTRTSFATVASWRQCSRP